MRQHLAVERTACSPGERRDALVVVKGAKPLSPEVNASRLRLRKVFGEAFCLDAVGRIPCSRLGQ